MRQGSTKQNKPASTGSTHLTQLASPWSAAPGRKQLAANNAVESPVLPPGFDFSRIPLHSKVPGTIQPKLTIDKPGDTFEQEADRVADQVMRMSDPRARSQVQARLPERAVGPAAKLQTKSHAGGSGSIAAPPIVHEVLRSSGRPLDAATRTFLEPRFGHDFSKVRVHADAKAGEAASSIDARAFTSGRSIVFGAGEFAPQTESGRSLLSHELMHVVQQGADGGVQHKATASIQRQPAATKSKAANQTGGETKTRKGEPATLPEVTITAERPKSADEIIKLIGALQEKLSSATTRQQARPIVKAIEALIKGLESAPISPTPKRDFVAGPIRFSEYGDYFYDFGFESMQDKHWREGWKAIYSLAAGPFGVVLDLCDAFLGSSEEEREGGAESFFVDQAADEIKDKGKDAGAALLKRGVPKGLSKGVAVSIKTFGKAIPVAIAAYEVYKANTEGPSPHAAALETAAMIMARVYGLSDGRDGVVRHGGFIPTPTTSYCRVARQQDGPFPQIKDRKVAFDLMGNRVYERMRDLIAPKHIETADAFYAFRKARLDYAWNIVEAAGGDLMGRKVHLVRGTEEQLSKLEESAASRAAYKEGPDIKKPFQLPAQTMASDQYSGIGSTIRQRYGLKKE
jgi:hypothetical protein